jgi:hypothetical protein
VDDVSFALRFAVGFEALEFESIPVPTRLRLCEEREVIVPGYRDTTDGTIKMRAQGFYVEDTDAMPPEQNRTMATQLPTDRPQTTDT